MNIELKRLRFLAQQYAKKHKLDDWRTIYKYWKRAWKERVNNDKTS